jgi:hypothetical protein
MTLMKLINNFYCYYNWLLFLLDSTHFYIVFVSSMIHAMFPIFVCGFVVIIDLKFVAPIVHFKLLQISSFLHIAKLPPYATIMWFISFLQL